MPGQPITVQRTDGNADVVKAYVRFWFQREPTTKAFNLETSHPQSTYNRPQFVQSQRILLPSDGSPIVLSAPFGGPIYFQMESLLPDGGANKGRFNVTAVFDNVAKHPTILDMSNNADVAQFVDNLLTSRLPAIDMRAEGLEVHARKDKLINGLRVYGFGNLVNYTGGAEGVQRLVDDYRHRFVEQQYTLAGFKVPGT